MARTMPSREQICQHLRELSKTKGMAVTSREYAAHPERLCSLNTVERVFGKRWNGVLAECGITVRDYDDPDQIVGYILAFYAREQRWPKARDFKTPCSYWVVHKVFGSSDNAVAAAVKLDKEKLKALEANGILLVDFLAQMLITLTPKPLPSTLPVKTGDVPSYGRPTSYELFPFAPQWESNVVALFFTLLGDRKLKHKFFTESVRPGRFPDCKAKEYVRSLQGYIDVWIEFEFRSYDFFKHGHVHSAHRCDYIVCWQNNWPNDVPGP